ncbi:MAG: hypothetical protein ABI557_08980 [Aureliella sp.]
MKFCSLSLIALIGMGVSAWSVALIGAQEPARPSHETVVADETKLDNSVAVLVSSNHLVGANLVDQKLEVKGRIADLAISRDGALAHAIVHVGGLLGVGGTHVAVPLQAIHAEQANDGQSADEQVNENSSWLRVDADLSRAPKLETPEHLELSDAAWLDKNFAFFGTKLPSPWAEGITAAQADSMLAVDDLIDIEVLGKGGESLAYLDAIILKLDGYPAVAYAVLGHGGVLGVGKEYVAISFSKLQVSTIDGVVHIVTALDATGLAEQQSVTPDAYPELRLQSVRKRVDK